MSTPATPVPTPVYDEAYYANYEGEAYVRGGQWMALAHHIADRVVTVLQPATALDVGCAIGLVVEALRMRGVDARGVDVSEYAISQVHEDTAPYCSVASLTDPIDGTYDLITCIEVIEHLPAADAETAVAHLCAASDRILLSSTPYGHEEPTHLNVQPPEYWTALFARQGFFRNLDIDASFVSPWAVVYEKARPDLVERVRAYDRMFWRQRDEILRIRTALLEATSGPGTGVADESTSADAAAQRIAELEAELLDARHGRLRVVDELEAETRRVGTALGRVAELEAEVARLQALRSRYDDVVTSTTWRTTWRVMTPYRVLRTKLGR